MKKSNKLKTGNKMNGIKLVWEFEPTIAEDDAILEAKAVLQEAGMSVELVGGRAKGRG